jgi:crotonobetainyl-CoA:carnitine CoA-transferase CaiB-like acyl-CoA transferase
MLANGYLQRREQPDGTTLALVANPIQFDEQAAEVSSAPGKGQHTDQVLGELGLTAAEVADLRARNMI